MASKTLVRLFLSLTCLALVLTAGCSKQPDDSSTCVPGETNVCDCPGGGEGVQVCEDDGTYGACDCSTTDPDAGSNNGDVDDCAEPQNACGGCATLSATPGDECDADGESGIWACDGSEAVECRTGDVNACGGDAELTDQPGDACGECLGGVWNCDGPDAVVCSAPGGDTNACGGCASLSGAPGDSCGQCEGVLACDGENGLVCEGGTPNLCGGCSELTDLPGTDCGASGIYVCEDVDTVGCAEDSRNLCGGTGTLENLPGDTCGDCDDGQYICASPELTVCYGASPPNRCGGCDHLEATPGTVCGVNGTWVCDGLEAVVCADEENNACGGTSDLEAEPGASCNDCDTGVWICSGAESLECTDEVDRDTDVQHCGSCDNACELSNAVPSCVSGQCEIAACTGEFDDCDTDARNGCETPLTTVDDCGSCDNSCDQLANATATCDPSLLQCVVDSCDQGFGNCNMLAADGCEADLTASFANCGACGERCRPGQRCAASDCARGFEITAGRLHTCLMDDSGEVYCWGGDVEGELGDGSGDSPTSRPQPVVGFSDAVQISTFWRHTCALRETGEVRCWGRGDRGQLGHGITGSSPTPVPVQNLSDAVTVDTGFEHSCAVRQTGEVVCWGGNAHGQLGDGSTTDSNVPVDVQGITDAIDVAAGGKHGGGERTDFSCAVLAGGGVKCWGGNDEGQLGDGTRTSSPTPVSVSGITDAIQIEVGYSSACVLRASGAIYCWGGDYGDSPAAVQGAVDVLSFDYGAGYAGSDQGCAVTADETAWCWGGGVSGQLGDGTTNSSPGAQQVPGLSGVVDVGTGHLHSCAVLENGEAWCWGGNGAGQLGDGQRIGTFGAPQPFDRLTPFPVSEWEPITIETSMCQDTIDNDGDGDADCSDSDCSEDIGSATGLVAALGDTCSGGNYFRGSCQSDGQWGRELLFRWTAPASGSFEIDTNGSQFDTDLYVFDGSCNGAEVACDQDSGTDGQDSSVQFDAISGQTFIVVVDGDGDQNSDVCGGAQLNISQL